MELPSDYEGTIAINHPVLGWLTYQATQESRQLQASGPLGLYVSHEQRLVNEASGTLGYGPTTMTEPEKFYRIEQLWPIIASFFPSINQRVVMDLWGNTRNEPRGE